MHRSRDPQAAVRSLRAALAKALVRALAMGAGLVLGAVVAAPLTERDASVAGADGGDHQVGRAAQHGDHDRVAHLVRIHRCWVDAASPEFEDELPGHVVVTLQGRLRYSSTLVGAALDHVFVSPHAGMVVHAFCP